jgi:glyoxylase-like metal-dependent hydrolase (beta-lactamase superfamily II)
LTFSYGERFTLGVLTIEARKTTGHTVGGVTYVVTGLARPVAIVGDALFAGSAGGGLISWHDVLATCREEILTLPPDTIICPGHGPLTTVAEELAHNPLFLSETAR